MTAGNVMEATEMEDAEWQYLLDHIEEDADTGSITVIAVGNATIPPLDITDWAEWYLTADSINNYCRKYTNKDDDPDSTALKICGKIRDILKKKDPKHYDPEHVCNIFMGCVRYHDLFPLGWDAETAARILSKVCSTRTAQEEAEERVEQSNQLADAVAREQEKREKEREAARAGRPLILKTCGDLADEASRRRVDYIGTDKQQTTTYFIEDQLRQTWYDITKAARIKESRGYVRFDGSEWHVDDIGRELSGAIAKAAESVARELHKAWFEAGGGSGIWAALEGIRKMLKKVSPDDITGMRQEPTISTAAVYEHGLTCKDGVIIIDADGIRNTAHDPDRDVWFGSVPVSVKDLLPNLTEMSFDEVVNHFPHARGALEACGPDKVRLMASMAGVAVYYTMPGHIPLVVWYYLWDAVEGGTGKSTHMRMFRDFFGKYIAFGVGWEVFTGEIKPLLSRVANTRPIWERLQPCEFTEKLRNTGKEFPCSDDEYYKFLLNVGCWVAAKLMARGSKACKKDLPYYVEPEDVAALCTRIPWIDILSDIGTWESGANSPLNAVYDCIKAELKRQGWTDADMKGAPELRNLSTFRQAVDGVTMQKRNGSGYPAGKGLLKVVGAGGELRKQSRHWVKNFQLTADAPTTGSTQGGADSDSVPALTWETPTPASDADAGDILRIRGEYIIYEKTGKIAGIQTTGDAHKSWNIEKYLEHDDPLPDIKECGRFGRVIYKPAVFHVHLEDGRQTLVNITTQ